GTLEIHVLYRCGTRSHSCDHPDDPLGHKPLNNITRSDAPPGHKPLISGYFYYPKHFSSTECNSGHISVAADPLQRLEYRCGGSSGYFPNSSRGGSNHYQRSRCSGPLNQ
ncbi:hypothetical protein HAX54_034861, partial [Datura stramonium]|nr:hypothetical protein [Datura stramonium]